MPLTDADFESILGEEKVIRGDITWNEDSDHSPALEFRADIESSSRHAMFVYGWYSTTSKKLNFALVLKAGGRIYGLDIGAGHQNPGGAQIGEKHKHRWSEWSRDEEAYVPDDIVSDWSDPVAVWREFCIEARIRHDGEMRRPYIQRELRPWT